MIIGDYVILPHFTSAAVLIDEFSDFFTRKVSFIRNDIHPDYPVSSSNILFNAGIQLCNVNNGTFRWVVWQLSLLLLS